MFSNTNSKLQKEVALELANSRVMLADNNGKITFINKSLTDFFKEKKSVLANNLSNFPVDGLIGQDLNVLQSDPAQQSKMIDDLQQKKSATIKIGDLILDLIASPLVKGSKNVGTLLEWRDAGLRLKNIDYKAQVEAISRSQVVIRFQPDGTILEANENFLKATGYREEEIIGKHHSMFASSGSTQSSENKSLWSDLQNGQYKSGEFKNVGKRNDEIWLQGTYNPLMDDNGEVASVIMFATDISEQKNRAERVTHVQNEISKDIHGIVDAVSEARNQAHTSSTASDDASSTVQSISVGLEQLVGSINEINGQVQQANDISSSAVREAEVTTETVASMSEAAQDIENVVNLISDIAEQTNLLALNATIEAARAGDAGRGFAVVAAEVKELANQTGKATDEINASISNVQKTSVSVVEAIGSISTTINKISEISLSIKAAISQQSTTTSDMSSSMHITAQGVQTIDQGVKSIADSLHIIEGSSTKLQETTSALG